MSHTPTPWIYSEPTQRNWFGHEVFSVDKQKVCETNRGMGKDQEARAEADAKHIVKCVNQHDDLVTAIHKFVKTIEMAGLESEFEEEFALAAKALYGPV